MLENEHRFVPLEGKYRMLHMEVLCCLPVSPTYFPIGEMVRYLRDRCGLRPYTHDQIQDAVAQLRTQGIYILQDFVPYGGEALSLNPLGYKDARAKAEEYWKETYGE